MINSEESHPISYFSPDKRPLGQLASSMELYATGFNVFNALRISDHGIGAGVEADDIYTFSVVLASQSIQPPVSGLYSTIGKVQCTPLPILAHRRSSVGLS